MTAPTLLAVGLRTIAWPTALDVPFGVSVIVDSWLGERLEEPTKH